MDGRGDHRGGPPRTRHRREAGAAAVGWRARDGSAAHCADADRPGRTADECRGSVRDVAVLGARRASDGAALHAPAGQLTYAAVPANATAARAAGRARANAQDAHVQRAEGRDPQHGAGKRDRLAAAASPCAVADQGDPVQQVRQPAASVPGAARPREAAGRPARWHAAHAHRDDSQHTVAVLLRSIWAARDDRAARATRAARGPGAPGQEHDHARSAVAAAQQQRQDVAAVRGRRCRGRGERDVAGLPDRPHAHPHPRQGRALPAPAVLRPDQLSRDERALADVGVPDLLQDDHVRAAARAHRAHAAARDTAEGRVVDLDRPGWALSPAERERGRGTGTDTSSDASREHAADACA
eukprot:Unigene1764_Nuclearia_a/m.5472 Unigene1764_Nuclearia_a/g.5472  ORF Unigene1764_Nuclearia_a/g.5472 Unigene1764_Nuclearia_a/m.5472 type:complete len:356 (-) Unigene1764_Nuclearia_a:330-1397(-)